jgi:hypothetical protein
MRGKLGHRMLAVHRRYGRWLRRLCIEWLYQMSPAGGDIVTSDYIVADDPVSALRRSDDHENTDPVYACCTQCEHSRHQGRCHAIQHPMRSLHGCMRSAERHCKVALSIGLSKDSLLIEEIGSAGRDEHIRPTQAKPVIREQNHTSVSSGVRPSGCCGAMICVGPICHCAGVESPFC